VGGEEKDFISEGSNCLSDLAIPSMVREDSKDLGHDVRWKKKNGSEIDEGGGKVNPYSKRGAGKDGGFTSQIMPK